MARKKSAAKRAKEAALKENGVLPGEVNQAKSTVDEIKTSSKKQVQSESDSDSEDESSSEEEDEFGDLITEDVEEGINKVLKAIKEDPTKLLDPKVKFFEDPENVTVSKEKKEKPMYLKDYHRINLLSGNYKDDDEDEEYQENKFGTVDGEKPFVVAQKEERDQLLSDIKNAFHGDNDDENDDDSDDDFLKKKEQPTRNELMESKEISRLPDPSQNEDGFLQAFVDSKAWIPKKDDKVINLDRIDQNDEEDFDEAVEQFERAYNFRYEDPNSAEIVSYARNQATMRRSATNSRKRQREKKHEEKEKEMKEKDELLKKKKTTKLNKVMDRLAKIKEAVGDDVKDEVIEKVFGDALLKDDFDDADWDSKMAQIFNEQYYEDDSVKPTWDEDDEIMADFHSKENGDDYEEDEGENPQDDEEIFDADAPPKKKSKKEKLKDKKSTKKEKESLRAKAQEIVEAKTHVLMDEVEEERGRSKDSGELKFRYREVSPETFGLTTRDILLADDKQLNSYIGIKKFAPYRPKEAVMKDKRKYTKKKHLQEWRKEVFRDKNGPPVRDDDKYDIWIPMEEVGEVKSSSKKSKKSGKVEKKERNSRGRVKPKK
ncbi:KRRI-interacting protein 1 [Scheffersomyces xylosifermentans]|uniref:KRRI-interacting protein 1 n=1 Tax=Scheffersomyces xylosifermentans TaxID=1304137 RepID=UPI00315DD3B7